MENINMNEQVMNNAANAAAEGVKTIGALPVIGLTIAGTLIVGAVATTVGRKAVKKIKHWRETRSLNKNSDSGIEVEGVIVDEDIVD